MQARPMGWGRPSILAARASSGTCTGGVRIAGLAAPTVILPQLLATPNLKEHGPSLPFVFLGRGNGRAYSSGAGWFRRGGRALLRGGSHGREGHPSEFSDRHY